MSEAVNPHGIIDPVALELSVIVNAALQRQCLLTQTLAN